MKKTHYSKLKLGAAPIVIGVALASVPAFAQDAEEGAATGSSEIVVTGTLIRNPNLESASPVNVTGEQEIKLRQSTSAELLLRETPGIVPNLGSNVNNGSVGSSRVTIPVIASGGVTNLDDVKALSAVAKDGIIGAITGRAIYQGTLDFIEAQKLADELAGGVFGV